MFLERDQKVEREKKVERAERVKSREQNRSWFHSHQGSIIVIYIIVNGLGLYVRGPGFHPCYIPYFSAKRSGAAVSALGS